MSSPATEISPETRTPAGSAPLAGRILKARWLAGAVLLGALLAYFTIALPDTFFTSDNFQSVLNQQAGLLMLALGVTLVLLIGEFDLSFAATVGLAGACAVLMMSSHGASAFVAIAFAVVIGLVVGLANGAAVTVGRAPAFIATLAVGFAATGVERLITDDKTISDGIPTGYLDFTSKQIVGLGPSTWLAIILIVVFAALIAFTTYGRRVRATGMNPTAATLAGIPVQAVRISAFALLGVLAALVGVILTSQGASYFPGSGTGLLLPPYAAVFLGAAIVGRGRFSMLATVYGVLFIAILENGLTMLDQPAAVIQLIEGVVLVAAVILARQERRA